MDGTYDTMSGHGGAGDAHRVVCPYTFLAEQECISVAAVAKAVWFAKQKGRWQAVATSRESTVRQAGELEHNK